MYFSTFWRGSFALLLAAISYFALKQNAEPGLESGVLPHMFAFFTLSVVAALAWPRLPLPVIGLGCALIGGAIELIQSSMGMGRLGQWEDWYVDLAGTALGLTSIWCLRRTRMAGRDH